MANVSSFNKVVDDIFAAVAQLPENTVEQFLDAVFGFLARKSNFFVANPNKESPEQILLSAFLKYRAIALKEKQSTIEKCKLSDEELKALFEKRILIAHGKLVKKESDKDTSDIITILVKGHFHDPIQFKLKKTTSFKKLMKYFTERMKIPLKRVEFKYHEDAVYETQSPAVHGMIDGDVIETSLKS